MMEDVEIDIDDDLLEKAREIAGKKGQTVEQLIADIIRDAARMEGEDDSSQAGQAEGEQG